MIDTHCHLLPGLDDGPESELESVQLARQLVSDGLTYVLCTPHFSRVYPTSTERAREALSRMREHLATLGIALELGLAAEVSSDLLLSAPETEIRERALSDAHVIVELDRGTPAALVARATSLLGTYGLGCVFAHPERCRAIRIDKALISDARAEGALFQVVVPSLAGRWGDDVAAAAWALVDDALIDLLATDAHRPSSTRRTLGMVLSRVAELYGDEALQELTEQAPRRLLGPLLGSAAAVSQNGASSD